jgi:hypothetical protein
MMVDPVLLEVLRNRLDAIADEMELTLLKSAASPIVKEGLDASAALFNTRGETIAQAAAIPIHLGALQFAAQRIVRAFPPEHMREGDAFLLNDPYDGGTHLPDITLAVPVFADGRAVAMACTMCHHQDVGGRTPGSVPTDATELYQEGVIIPPTQLFRSGKLDDNVFRLISRNVRLPEVFTGDLMAQMAAGRLGGLRLRELVAAHGTSTVTAYIDELLDRAERLTRRQIEAIPDGDYGFEDWLDDDGVSIGQPVKIAVTLRVRGSSMTFDFTGSDPQVLGPFNSVPASTMSAVYYAVRAISDASIPNNGGCFRAVDAVLPEGTIVNPRPPAPVSCRTATIKRIADTILGALVGALPGKMPAASSGTLLVMAFGGRDPESGRPFVAIVQVPVLHISGWYDDEQIGTPLNYVGVSTKGAPDARKAQRLLMGPWPHALNSGTKLGEVEFGPTAKIDINAVWLRFFDRWLKGLDNGLDREPPVRIFVMGENVWRDEAEWPLARARYTKYYLHGQGRSNSLNGDGALSTSEPKSEKPDIYTHDPAKPVPFLTDPTFAQLGGPDDYRSVERRDDVLVYTTEPLSQDTEVCGPVKARLWASTSGRDADFMAKLLDVWPDGFAQRLSDGMVRARFREGMDRPAPVDPGRVYPLDVDVWNTCQLLRAGHRIRLEIASSAFPKFDRNPSTGEPLGKTTRLERSEQKILHDREHPSHVVLPIVPRKP